MAVRGTKSYVYFTDITLGSGASGNVYFGRHKRRGDPCAIKVFRSLDGGAREMQLRQREFNVMSSLDHDNIVKFIAIESESHGSDKVLIMELCTGGSVYKMLEDPENAFGFCEDEFLVFLSHLTKALQYLRQNHIVHRDIKPGNILRYVKDDLSSLYKLTDFGAARELQENEEFVSLYGTEEYLHPDLYARALMRHQWLDQYPKAFSASVDLWSLGVTLYHVATGRLPFQPFGGRKNREAMHMIISKKDSGFISGIQQTMDGSIEWSRELPRTCLLSGGLRKLLVPILVGLLESVRRYQWTFDNFFHASKDITSRRIVHVFCVSNCSQNRLYLGREEGKSLTHFQNVLADVTKIPPSQQLLFHESWSVESLVAFTGNDSQISIQTTSPERPLFIIPVNQVSARWDFEKHEIPSLPTTPPVSDLSEDAVFSRSTCAFVIFLQRKTDDVLRAQSLLANAASHLGKLLVTNSQNLQLTFQSLAPMYEKLINFKSTGLSILHKFDGQFKELATVYGKVDNAVAQFSQDVTSRSLLLMEFLKTFSAKICPSFSCSKKQAHLVKELETIRIAFKDHKKKDKDLSYNEQQIHRFDRGRAGDGVKKSMDLYGKHCIVNTEATWKSFCSYHSLYSKRKEEIEQTENLLRGLLDKIATVNENLFNLLIRFAEDDRSNREKDETDRADMSDTKTPSSWFRSDVDSAFVNDDVVTTAFYINQKRPFVDSDDRIRNGYHISRETMPEEVGTDSGVEMIAESLKGILRDTSDLLEITVSVSNENNEMLQKLHSKFVDPMQFSDCN